MRPQAPPPLWLADVHLAGLPGLPPLRPPGSRPVGEGDVVIPAGFGAVLAAIAALDASLNRKALDALDADDVNDAWRAAGQVCDAADALYAKMRAEVAGHIARGSRNPEGAP